MDINKKGLTAGDFYKDRLTFFKDKESGFVYTTSDWDEVTECMNDFAEYKIKELDGLLAQEKELVCGSKCDYGHRDEKGNDLYCCIKKTK